MIDPETSEEQPEPLEEAVASEVPPEVAAQMETLRADLARSQDRHRRALADLDNYRKRVERDGEQRAKSARNTVLIDWLDAFDSVERALWLEPGEDGLLAVLGQMEGILARHGVRRMDALGAAFDPQRHEAIAAQPSTDVPARTVLDVARSGFEFADGTVLRPAQVVVSQRPDEAGDGA
ncbi:MAG: nucleotide exchange factor GrpE [Acidimicrobiia bacterium]